MKQCECCGHPLPDERLKGVRMSPVKRRIFDLIWEASPRGMSSETIRNLVYASCPNGGESRNVITNHIRSMNAKHLRPLGMEIKSEIGRGMSNYTLRKVNA
jgi:hypothetical protein